MQQRLQEEGHPRMCSATYPTTDRIDLLGEAADRAYATMQWLRPDVIRRTGPRVVEAMRDPQRATPKLAREAAKWRGHPFAVRHDDGRPMADAHETIVKVLL